MFKWVLLSQGSANDPKISEQEVSDIDGVWTLAQYFKGFGVLTLETDIVNSCHGNSDHTKKTASDMQRALILDRRIVGMGHGSLSFAKPGIEAAISAVIPLISVPMYDKTKPTPAFGGLDTFLSCDTPPGASAVAVAGLFNYAAAASVALKILDGKWNGIYVDPELPDSVAANLGKYGIPFTQEAKSLGQKLCLVGIPGPSQKIKSLEQSMEGGFILSYPLGCPNPEDALRQFYLMQNVANTLFIAGDPSNLAHYAAKIIGLGDKGIQDKLIAMRDKKAGSYALDRDIISEMAAIEAKMEGGR